ncbi:MAG: PDZ domain-containing protein, partial [Candidatus Aminicenantes bacterium]|nr:PDZ domain-containing protein [Candidatus Aminicenantes bacterium]
KEVKVKVKLGEYTEEDAWREMEMRFPRLFVGPEAKALERAPFARQAFSFETRKYIGVYVDPLNKELAEYFGVKEGLGLLVANIREDAPAEKAGLKVGDVLVKADEKKLERQGDLSRVIQEKEKGDKIKIEFYRDKKLRSVEVEIEEEESDEILIFSPEDWEDYTKTWGRSSENILRQQRKWQDESGREFRKQIERMNRELEEQSKRFEETLKKRTLRSRKYFKAIRA